MTNAKEEKKKDLRDRLANPEKDKWYNNVVVHIASGAEDVFMPTEEKEYVKVVKADAAVGGSDMKEVFSSLNEHSLLIYGEVCDASLMEHNICISVNDLWSKPSDFVVGLVLFSFRHLDYHAEINKPFTLVLAPRLDFDYHALSIVINKRLFVDEKTQETEKEKVMLIRQNLTSLYGILCSYWEEL